MATITLYKDKVNGVGSLLDDIIKSSNNLSVQLGTLKNTLQGVDSSTCNLQDTVDSISSSSKSEDDKVEDLKTLNNKLSEFIEMTANRDSSAKDEINEAKEEFYTKYSYLKPDCEKSTWERIKEALKKAAEWCKENWVKIVVAVVLITIAAIVVIATAGAALGPIATLAVGAAKGVLLGAAIGGLVGGISGYAQNGIDGILPGILGGASDGAIMGAIFGMIGLAGGLAGSALGCSAFMEGLFAVSSKLSLGMMGFDCLALLNDFQTRFEKDTGINLGIIDPNVGQFISDLNHKAHENPYYNALQLTAGGVAAFSGGYVNTAKCFIAGTLVATANGLVAIENIKAGDMVCAAHEDTLEYGLRPVAETYIRETDTLVHITVSGVEIVSTVDHPYFVKNKGFVNAGDLCIGFELMDNNGNTLVVEQIFRETLHDETVKVYNFQVEEYHTYYVSDNEILVHNAERYGNGHYEHNPSENEKVLADTIEDPDAVYGYRPSPDGSLKDFADFDWTDPEMVAQAQQQRLSYIEQDRAILNKVAEMRNSGCTVEEIAQTACEMRNETRLNMYRDAEGNITNQAGYNAALERQNATRSYSALIESGKTPEQIIESSTRTNPGMDACVGLYDQNYDTYIFN